MSPSCDWLPCHARAVRYVEQSVDGPGVARYLEALAPTRKDGATKVVRLKAVDVADSAAWFRTGALIYEHETFRNLFTSEAAMHALPEVLVGSIFPSGEPPAFDLVTSGPLMLEGELAGLLSRGGAYVRFAGTDSEAKRLAADAARDLLQDRYEDFRVYFSYAAWSSWFDDIAWDATWVLVDDVNREVTILVTTDTD